MVPVFKRISLDMTSSTPSSLFDHYFHFIFFRFLILWHPSAKPVYDVNLEYTLSCCDSVYSRFAYLVYFRWKQIKYLPLSFILKCELSARVCSRRITDKLRWDATWVRLGFRIIRGSRTGKKCAGKTARFRNLFKCRFRKVHFWALV